MAWNSDVYYTYTFYDNSGDQYYGWGVQDEVAGYYTGLSLASNDGFYSITGTYNYDVDYGMQGLVAVTGYYDYQSGSYSTSIYDDVYAGATALGLNGLGSESGYVYNTSVNNYTNYFGYGGYYDASLSAYT